MKKITTLMMGLLVVAGLNAQDTKSKEILKELSDKAQSFSTIKANFTKTFEKRDTETKTSGKMMVKGDKFFMNTGEGQDFYCDGKTVWTHVIDDAEVYKCSFNEVVEDPDFLNPRDIFTIWEKGFKTRYVKEQEIKGSMYHVINLHPLKPEEKKYHTVTLKIHAEKKEVGYVIIQSNDGSRTIYKISSFTTNEEIPDSKFRWQNKPGIDVLDC